MAIALWTACCYTSILQQQIYNMRYFDSIWASCIHVWFPSNLEQAINHLQTLMRLRWTSLVRWWPPSECLQLFFKWAERGLHALGVHGRSQQRLVDSWCCLPQQDLVTLPPCLPAWSFKYTGRWSSSSSTANSHPSGSQLTCVIGKSRWRQWACRALEDVPAVRVVTTMHQLACSSQGTCHHGW